MDPAAAGEDEGGDPSEGAGMNCQHAGCTCTVEQGQEFCGDYCREHAAGGGHETHACECGHPGCM
jgi:hypothetical protein